MRTPEPLRGDVWDLDLDPIKGHEQAGSRPALILSVDLFNEGPAELVVVVPLTRTKRNIRWQPSAAPFEPQLRNGPYVLALDSEEVRRALDILRVFCPSSPAATIHVFQHLG